MRESLAPAPGRFPDADALGSRMRLSAGYVAANPRVFGEQPPADALPAVLAALYLLIDWNAHAPGAKEGVDAYLARQLSPRQIDDMANWRQRLSREGGINDPPAGMDDPPAFDALLPQLAQAISDALSLTIWQTTELRTQLQSCFDDTGPYSPPPPPVMPKSIRLEVLHEKHPIIYTLIECIVDIFQFMDDLHNAHPFIYIFVHQFCVLVVITFLLLVGFVLHHH